MKFTRPRFRLARFNIRQLLLLTMLIAILLALIANARRQLPVQAYQAIAFSHDGTRIAIAGGENTQIFELANKSLLGTVLIGFSGYGGCQVVCFKDNDTVVLWSQGLRIPGPAMGVYSYSIVTNELVTEMIIGTWGDSKAVCPTGFAVRDKALSKLTFYPFDPDESTTSIDVRKGNDRIWLSESGRFVTLFSDFSHSRARPARSSVLHNLENTDAEFDLFRHPHSDAVLSPDGSRMLLAGKQMGARLLDRQTREIVWSYKHGEGAEDSRFSADGSLVGIQGIIDIDPTENIRDYFVSVLSADTGKEILRVDTTDGMQSAFAFSPDGKTIAVADGAEYFRGVQLWDVQSGQMVGRIGGTSRFQLLILYPILMLIWSLIWVRFGPSGVSIDHAVVEQNDVGEKTKKPGWRIALFAGITVLGFLIVGWFSAICFFSMSDYGQFGQLKIWSQMLASAIVAGACLLGIWLMVVGFRGSFRRRVDRNQPL